MIDNKRLFWIPDLLVENGLIHDGQKQDVLNRGRDQARHILLDKRAQMRRMLGRHRVAYRVTEIELSLLSLLQSQRRNRTGGRRDDYRLGGECVGFDLCSPRSAATGLQVGHFCVWGPFAERHLIVAVEDTDSKLVIAMADPWDTELVESIARVKNKEIQVLWPPRAKSWASLLSLWLPAIDACG